MGFFPAFLLIDSFLQEPIKYNDETKKYISINYVQYFDTKKLGLMKSNKIESK